MTSSSSSAASHDFDLLVIGAGSGGVRAARMAARHGARVAVVEERYLGGTCVNVGCVPKKLLVHAAHFAHDFEDAQGYGWTVEAPRHDWNALREAKDAEIARLNDVYARLLDDAGVTRLAGHARLVDAHRVALGERRLSAETLLLATGSWPHMPDIPGIEHAVSSNEVFHWKELPGQVAIVGGGYIACEFAGILHGLGVDVTLLYRGSLFLRGFDDDVRRQVAAAMREDGIDVRFGVNVDAIHRADYGLRLDLTTDEVLECEQVLFATGRRPLTDDLGLDAAGVERGSKGEIRVNAYSRTNVPHIWAIGDCTDRLNLTPVAIHEAMCFVRTVYGGEPSAPDYHDVPSAVFSQPPIASVGLTEAEARERHGQVDVYRASFKPLLHALTGRELRMLVKLVVDRASDRVLGCHLVGPDAPEMVQGFATAIRCGARKADLDATVGIHPTSAEELFTLRDPEPAAPSEADA